jgi:hypothetical protein
MSAAYVGSAKQNILLAENKIVRGRFRIMNLATEAVDTVHRSEHRRLTQEDTNVVAQEINGMIISIKRQVGGYRYRENCKTAINFCFNGRALHQRYYRKDRFSGQKSAADLKYELDASVRECESICTPQKAMSRTLGMIFPSLTRLEIDRTANLQLALHQI